MTVMKSLDSTSETLADRRVSYHEREGLPLLRYFLFRPSTTRPGAPLAISVHGIARNAAAHAFRLMEDAERLGVCVLAPLFEKDAFGQYQQLQDRTRGVRSDLALLKMIDEAAGRCEADPDRLLLFGFSGGAQFAHRFAMMHPDRVASAVIASAGWYTLPRVDAPYPFGLDTASFALDAEFDVAKFLRVPFHVFVGELDTERDGSLRQSRLLDSTQGATRIARARTWVEAMTRAAASEGGRAPTLSVLPGVGHDFNDCIERAGLSQAAFRFFAEDAALTLSAPAKGDINA